MRAIVVVLSAFAAAMPARADLAPDRTDPTTPDGALVWLTVVAAVAALAAMWWRRRR